MASASWSKERREHWAFQPDQAREPCRRFRTPIGWPIPVDAFILAKLEKNDMKPNPPADKRTLIRRATYDLTGLPPTPEEVQAFVEDNSPDAYCQSGGPAAGFAAIRRALGPVSGSIPPATPIPKATSTKTRTYRFIPTPGPIAIMSCAPSTRTSPTTDSSWNKSPPTECRRNGPQQSGRLGFPHSRPAFQRQ